MSDRPSPSVSDLLRDYQDAQDARAKRREDRVNEDSAARSRTEQAQAARAQLQHLLAGRAENTAPSAEVLAGLLADLTANSAHFSSPTRPDPVHGACTLLWEALRGGDTAEVMATLASLENSDLLREVLYRFASPLHLLQLVPPLPVATPLPSAPALAPEDGNVLAELWELGATGADHPRTALALAERLDVDQKTIRRAMKRLQAAGLVGPSRTGHRGGYHLTGQGVARARARQS